MGISLDLAILFAIVFIATLVVLAILGLVVYLIKTKDYHLKRTRTERFFSPDRGETWFSLKTKCGALIWHGEVVKDRQTIKVQYANGKGAIFSLVDRSALA